MPHYACRVQKPISIIIHAFKVLIKTAEKTTDTGKHRDLLFPPLNQIGDPLVVIEINPNLHLIMLKSSW